jgi:hypothetical protein
MSRFADAKRATKHLAIALALKLRDIRPLRCAFSIIQGLVLQVTWGEEIDVDACVLIVDRMLQSTLR